MAAAGAMVIYQQASDKDYMLSSSPTEGVSCGYANVGDIGMGFSAAQQGTVPLYRLYNAAAGLHLCSTSSTEGTQVGYVLEALGAYVCPL